LLQLPGQPSYATQLSAACLQRGAQLACSHSPQAAHCCCHVLLVFMWSLKQTVLMCMFDIVIYQGN
jgi:hypothetical protein